MKTYKTMKHVPIYMPKLLIFTQFYNVFYICSTHDVRWIQGATPGSTQEHVGRCPGAPREVFPGAPGGRQEPPPGASQELPRSVSLPGRFLRSSPGAPRGLSRRFPGAPREPPSLRSPRSSTGAPQASQEPLKLPRTIS